MGTFLLISLSEGGVEVVSRITSPVGLQRGIGDKAAVVRGSVFLGNGPAVAHMESVWVNQIMGGHAWECRAG